MVPLADLLTHLAQPAALVTRGGAITWANPAFEALFRPGPVCATLAEWEAGSPPGPGPVWEELTRRRSAVRNLSSEAGVALFHLTFIPGRDGEGVLLCATAPAQRGLQELRERTAVADALFRSLEEGVMALDAQDRITALSLSGERITGFAEAEVLGRPWRDVFEVSSGADRPSLAPRSGDGLQRNETEIRGKGGRSIHVSVSRAPLRDPGGALDGSVVVFRDLGEMDRLREEVQGSAGFHGIVGGHPSMLRVVEWIESAAPSDAPILILGEAGTGKDLAARTLHGLSGRRDGPFVKVSCTALADSLLERELFGYAQAAFPGAVKDHAGRFEAARGGTLFLDAVDAVPLAVQTKLMGVLREGELERLGESESRRVDVRVVASTERDLRRECQEGHFREDLLDRLSPLFVHLPPLRDRREDIPFLADHFLKRLALKEGRRKVLSPSIHSALQSYPWPGNVRELESAVAHAYVCTSGDVISMEALPEPILRVEAVGAAEVSPESEFQTIYAALNACDWNKGEAARRLGLSRTTLWRRMRELGIRTRRRPRLRS